MGGYLIAVGREQHTARFNERDCFPRHLNIGNGRNPRHASPWSAETIDTGGELSTFHVLSLARQLQLSDGVWDQNERMSKEPAGPKNLASHAILREKLISAADNPEQAARVAVLCVALMAALKALSVSMVTARTQFHLNGLTTKEMPKIEQGQFLALSLLSDTAASLSNGIVTMIEAGNLYAASALLRQIVEIEYLAWAFANDPDEVVDWYNSTHDDRTKRWQPRHLRDRSHGKFRGKDYAEHCETGGHPTPDGMRNLLHGDQQPIAAMLRQELANHGSSAWKYLLDAVVVICQEHRVEPVDIIPGAETTAVIDADAEWRQHDVLGAVWSQFVNVRDGALSSET